MAPEVPIPNLDDLIERYVGGVSLKQLGDESGVSRSALARRFRQHGVEIRGQSEAERLKWQVADRRTVERQLSAAWTARRGSVDSMETKIRRARTMGARLHRVGKFEHELAELLRGVQQRAVGPYNVDVALRRGRVAVEIQSTNGFPIRLYVHRERTEYLLDAGWHVLYVMHRGTFALKAVAEQVRAFAKLARRDESGRGQYGMIRGDGKPATGSRQNFNGLSRVPGF